MNGPHMENVLTNLVNRPVLVAPGAMPSLLADIRRTENGTEDEGNSRLHAALLSDHAVRRDGYFLDRGIAVIPVMGPTMHRSWWRTSYEGLSGAHDAAQNDPEVKAIAWVIDSPGGMVAGVFDFADEIYQARGNKPAVAIVSEMAASAAYLIASAVGEIIVPRTGEVGSVGVVMQHWDFSAALEEMGVNQTYIYAGDHKVDGNPYQPLPKDVQDRFQGEIDHVYGMFVDAVARNRGMSREAVIGTQALTYIGDKAVQVGFADRVEATRDVMASMITKHGVGTGQLSMGQQTNGMSAETEKPASGAEVAALDEAATGHVSAGVAQLQAENARLTAELSALRTEPAKPAEIIRACSEAGVGTALASTWIDQGLSMREINRHLTFASDIRDKCAAANIDPGVFLAHIEDPARCFGLALADSLAREADALHIDGHLAAVTSDPNDPHGWGHAMDTMTKKNAF